MKLIKTSALACLIGLVSASAAFADDCSGRDHVAGTVLGAAGGAAIGGAVSHDAGGAIAGAVVGGLAGNAIARSQDCNRQTGYRNGYDQPGYDRQAGQPGYDRQAGYDSGQQNFAYPRGYNVAPDENDYWGVESHQDFSADYRHIWQSIERGRQDGTFSRYQARRYTQQLQQIQTRADWQERRGQFDAQDIESQLSQLRRTMYVARQENGDNTDNGYNRR